MMTDKELADRVVELGIGRASLQGNWYTITAGVADLSAEQFVQDWRVAGALMEKAAKEKKADFGFKYTPTDKPEPTYQIHVTYDRPPFNAKGPFFNTSAPRAIIEAWVDPQC